MQIRTAQSGDYDVLLQYDTHIDKEELIESINRNRIYIVKNHGEFIGWLRYNLFWDNTPFMNMLFIIEKHRSRGYGRKLVQHWEAQMRQMGFDCVMTSTVSEEYAQHFYVKLGYRAIGGFNYKNDPYEIILMKELQ